MILAKRNPFTRDMELVWKVPPRQIAEWGIRFIAVVDHVDTQDRAGKARRKSTGLSTSGILRICQTMCARC